MTQPSWPAGMSKTVFGPISNVVPSSIRRPSRPLTHTPRWWYWQEAVPAMGLTSVAQCQPGWKTVRPMMTSSSVKISRRPFGNVLTSSGAPRDLAWSRAIAGLSLNLLRIDRLES